MIRHTSLALCTLLLFTRQVFAEDMSKGEYIARTADCVACHTQSGDKPLAGGKAFLIPFAGVIYSTNITPDKKHGIGNYTLEDFVKSMRKGEAKDGHSLYPAMPYTSYAKMSDDDLKELFNFLQKEVQPLDVANKPSEIPWPLSMRWPLGPWKSMFHDETPFKEVPGKSAEWNRGAYLVQGAGHCGGCHTPRGVSMEELALTEKDERFLSGSELIGWYSPDIRGTKYEEQALIDLLKTGRSKHLAVSGSMSDVITHSTQYFTDSDLKSIAVYLRSLSSSPARVEGKLATVTDSGKASYAMYCSTCHGMDGKGTDYTIPALVNNPTVLESNPATLLNIMLNGAATPATEGHQAYTMPGYGWVMNDKQMADLMNTVRASWGNKASEIQAKDVEKQRKHVDYH